MTWVLDDHNPDDIVQRLYSALALFDSRQPNLLSDIARAAREGAERAEMGEPNPWNELEYLMAKFNDLAPSEKSDAFYEYGHETAKLLFGEFHR